MKLKPGEMYDIPPGSSNKLKVDKNIEHWNKININPVGPPIKYVQESKTFLFSMFNYISNGIYARRYCS